MSGLTLNTQNLQTAASRVATSLAATQTTAAASSTSSTTDDGDTISSNDFLTLLVTEMKNQDPTQPTDPNAYIQQLVGVNSLQQLISINQELGSATSGSSSSSAVAAAIQPATAS